MNKASSENRKWILAAFLICTLIFAFRTPNILFKSYLWAEDGSIFLTRALNMGFASVLEPYAGYLHFVSQSLTCASVLLSKIFTGGISIAPQIMQLFALLIEGFSFSYLVSNRFEFILKKPQHRLFTSAFLSLMCRGLESSDNEVFSNLTNSQWFFGFLILIICLKMIYELKITDSKFETVILVLTGISSPVSIISLLTVVIVFTANCIKKQFSVVLLVKSIIIAVTPIAEYCFILTSARNGAASISDAVFTSIIAMIYTVPSILYYPLLKLAGVKWLGAVLGLLSWAIIVIVLRKRDTVKFLICSIAYAAFVEVLCMYSVSSDIQNVVIDVFNGNGSRYIVISQDVFIMLTAAAFCKLNEQGITRKVIAAGTALSISCGSAFLQNRNDAYCELYSSSTSINLYDTDGAETLYITVSPDTNMQWHVEVPVSLNKLNTKDNSSVVLTCDTVNGVLLNDVKSDTIPQGGVATIRGWAIEQELQENPSAVYVKIGDYIFPAEMLGSPDVDSVMGSGEGDIFAIPLYCHNTIRCVD